MTHERTPTGRAFLNLQRKVQGLMQCELYLAACNSPSEYHQQLLEAVNGLFLRRYSPTSRGEQ